MKKGVIYVRVSTSEQGESGLGLEAQISRCSAYAARSEIEVADVVSEVQSGKNLNKRPLLLSILDRLKLGELEVLVVAKLDRLSRSVIDLCSILELSEKQGWSIVLLDLGIDTTTPAGRVQAQVIAAFAEYERRLISQRTKEAMKAAKDRGIHCGVTSPIPQEIVERIVHERLEGKTWISIAIGLDYDLIPTAREASFWQVGSVQSVFNSIRGMKFREKLQQIKEMELFGLNCPSSAVGIVTDFNPSAT